METPAPPRKPEALLRDPAEALKALEAGTLDGSTLTRKERLPIVAHMRARGYTQERSAALVGRTGETIRQDWRAIERQGALEMGQVSVKAIGFGHTSQLMACYQEAMDTYREARRAGEFTGATSALAEARRCLESVKKLLQDLGLLHKEPDRIQVEVLARNLFLERLGTLAEIIHEHVPEEERPALRDDFQKRLAFPLVQEAG